MASRLLLMRILNMKRMELSSVLVIKSGMSLRLVKLRPSFMTRILSLILCMVFLIFVIPSPKVKAIAGVDDLALLLIASLGAFGISFAAVDGINSVGPWVVDKFESFVGSIGESFDSVISSLRYGVDKSGNLLGSPESLDYSARFALALQHQYSLSDNSSISVSSSFDYLPVLASPTKPNLINYGFPSNHYLVRDSSLTSPNFYSCSSSSSSISFVVLEPNSNVISESIVVSSSPSTVYYYNGFTDSVGTFSVSSFSSEYGLYYFSLVWPYMDSRPDIPVLLSSDRSYVVSSLDEALFLSSSTLTINTGSIDIPQVGDYSDQDGILIDGLGSWGDTLQDILDKVSGLSLPDVSWPTVTWGAELADQLVDSLVSAGELTTENSPGFFNGLPLVGGIPDIQFGTLWHYVTDWVTSMSGGLALIGGIMFSLPFVSAFYAVVVILLVLSLWRLLRSA